MSILYASTSGPDGSDTFGTDVTGLPTIVTTDSKWGSNVASVGPLDAALSVDVEVRDKYPRLFDLTTATRPGFVAKGNASVRRDVAAYIADLDPTLATMRAAHPTRRLIAYTDLPIHPSAWYVDVGPYHADQRKFIPAFARADAIGVDCYVDASLAKDVTPEWATRYTAARLSIARELGKPIVTYVSPNFNGGGAMPIEVFRATVRAAIDAGADVCVWGVGLTADEARRQADALRGAGKS